MEQKSNEFIVDLNLLNTHGDKRLEKFSTDEQINIKDVIKIVNSEAERNGVKDIAKVTFETYKDDSFKIIVEQAEKQIETKTNEIIIFPYDKIQSNSSEIKLEDFIGKITIYNNEEKKFYTTIDGVSLNLFTMTYKAATELLCNISDRREKNGYIKEENKIAFKEFGIVVNKDKEKDAISNIDVYTKEEINNQYKFIEEKYDVDISKIGNSLEYKVPEFNPKDILNDTKNDIENREEREKEEKEKYLEEKLLEKFNLEEKNDEIEIELPEEDKKEDNSQEVKKAVAEEGKQEESTLDNSEIDKEIEELTELYEKQKEQQRILENRISKKLEELKKIRNNKKEEKNKLEDIKLEKKDKDNSKEDKNKIDLVENIKDNKDNKDIKSFVIESYKGLKEQGKGYLSVYLGQSKDDIRAYFKTTPKEVNDFEEMEMYNNFYAYYDEEDKCTGIGIYNQEDNNENVAMYLFGKNLMDMPYKDIVKLIKDHDYKAIEDEDGIISLEYGISVDPKEDKDYKNSICDVIHLFKRGYYDEVYNV